MEVRAVGKRLRVPPRKARLVANEVKGKHAVVALAELRYHPSKGARLIRKVLRSAVGNAVENHNLEPDSLIVRNILVDEGWRLKRLKARAQGRGNIILRRTSHITVILEEGAPFEIPRSNAKPKPRPKFESPKVATKKPKPEKTAVSEEAPAEAGAETAAEASDEQGGEASAETTEAQSAEEPTAAETSEENKE
jgi:large subunit ribosomal protein L22